MLGVSDIFMMAGSFFLIILILLATWYATRWYARRMGPSVGGRNIRVIDRANLANNAALVIAEICGRYYLFGVSERQVNLIQELPDFREEISAARQDTFATLMQKLMAGKSAVSGEKEKENDGEPQ